MFAERWKKRLRRPLLCGAGAAAVGVASLGVLGGCALSRIGDGPDDAELARFTRFPNWRDGRFQNTEPIRLDRKKIAARSGLFRFLLHRYENAPASPPKISPPRLSPAPAPAGAAVWWFGHSTLLWELAGVRFLTDPVFGNAAPVPGVLPRFMPPPLTMEELPKLDFILISHDHYDHLEADFVRSRRSTSERFVTTPGVGARLRGWGIGADRIVELNWGESTAVGGVRITAVESRHFSGRTLDDRDRTLWAAFVIEGAGRKIFFGADGGYGRHFRKIGEQFGPFDLVCLEIDAWNERWPDNHLFPRQVPAAFADLRGRLLLPIHYGVFDLARHPYGESLALVKRLAADHRIPMAVPAAGEKVEIPSGGRP